MLNKYVRAGTQSLAADASRAVQAAASTETAAARSSAGSSTAASAAKPTGASIGNATAAAATAKASVTAFVLETTATAAATEASGAAKALAIVATDATTAAANERRGSTGTTTAIISTGYARHTCAAWRSSGHDAVATGFRVASAVRANADPAPTGIIATARGATQAATATAVTRSTGPANGPVVREIDPVKGHIGSGGDKQSAAQPGSATTTARTGPADRRGVRDCQVLDRKVACIGQDSAIGVRPVERVAAAIDRQRSPGL